MKTLEAQYDAVVIGAGHNGLVAAATLARQGKSVCVVERGAAVGGMARNTVLAPGVAVPQMAHLLYNLNPVVAKEMGLAALASKVLPTVSLATGGKHVVIRGAQVSFSDGSAHPEAAAYAALQARLLRFAGLLGQMSLKPPPSLAGGVLDMATLKEFAGLARLGIGLKRLGKAEMREFLRILLSNAYDLILDEFEDGPLAGALAADAVRGAYAGPRSPGTVFSLMYRMGNGGAPRLPMGGMGAVAEGFAASARAAGCDIQTGCGVARVIVEEDRARGVVLEDGRVIRSGAVLSSIGAFATMRLAGVQHFDVEAVRRLRNLRNKGTVAKVNLVLSGLPAFTGLNAELTAGRLLIAPQASFVERAFNPVKYGQISDEPVIEAVIPSLSDPGLCDGELCDGGQHVVSAIVQYVPYALEGGWIETARAQVQKLVVDALEMHAPGLGKLVTHAEVLTPL
ncbi:MAG: NAD(P)/FAD-dependent oxidoreductase, partial [Pseudorhodobacter sp.]